MHEIAASYDAMADLYVDRFGDVELQHPLDRATFAGFARLLRRVQRAAQPRVADLGCGPGPGTSELAAHDLDVVGIAASAGLLAHARRRLPHLPGADHHGRPADHRHPARWSRLDVGLRPG